MITRLIALAAVLCLAVVCAAAQSGPKIFLFDVLRRPDYRIAYERMLKGERALPPWMATVEATIDTTEIPGKTAKLGGDERELFTACEPHNCGGHTLVVMFSGFGTQVAKGLLSVEGSARLLGKPSKAEAALLLANAPSD